MRFAGAKGGVGSSTVAHNIAWAIGRDLALGQVEVSVVDPVASMQAVENPGLASIAKEVQDKLKGVLDSL